MNAGYIPLDHWVHGPEGGGRNIGEACHVYDVFDALDRRATCSDVDAQRRSRPSDRLARERQLHGDDLLRRRLALHADLHGARRERSTRRSGWRCTPTASCSRSTTTGRSRSSGRKAPLWSSRTIDKGHRQELEALAECLLRGGPWPISLEEQLRATRISFDVEAQIRTT